MTSTENIKVDNIVVDTSNYVSTSSKKQKVQEEQVVSNKKAKSKKFILNNRTTAAPKVSDNQDFADKTVAQLLAIYNTFNKDEKLRSQILNELASRAPNKLEQMYLLMKDDASKADFLKEIAKVTPSDTFQKIYSTLTDEQKVLFLSDVINITYNSLSADQRKVVDQMIIDCFNGVMKKLPLADQFIILNNLSLKLKDILNTNTQLTDDEKKVINSIINNINDYINGNSVTPLNGNIKNLMMIIVKAFNDTMTAEGLDQITQINDTKLLNKFLEVAQKVLQDNISKENGISTSLDNTDSSGTGFWVTLGVIVGLAVLSVVVPMFAPAFEEGAEVGLDVLANSDRAALPEATALEEGGGAAAREMASSAEAIGTDASAATRGINAGEKALTPAGDSAASAAKTEARAAEDVSRVDQAPKEGESKEAPKKQAARVDEAGLDAARQDGSQAAAKPADTAKELTKEGESKSRDIASKAAEKEGDAASKVQDAFKKDPDSVHKVPRNWSKDQVIKIGPGRFANRSSLKSMVWSRLKFVVSAAMAAYVIESGAIPSWMPGKAGQALSGADQAKLTGYQQTVQYEQTVITQNNNDQTTVSKRVGDDSEKVSQSSGFVQQAINMFGQAMSFRA